jgi:hypothetical protein
MEPDVPELFDDGHEPPELQTDAEFDFEMKRFMNI